MLTSVGALIDQQVLPLFSGGWRPDLTHRPLHQLGAELEQSLSPNAVSLYGKPNPGYTWRETDRREGGDAEGLWACCGGQDPAMRPLAWPLSSKG